MQNNEKFQAHTANILEQTVVISHDPLLEIWNSNLQIYQIHYYNGVWYVHGTGECHAILISHWHWAGRLKLECLHVLMNRKDVSK